MAWNRDGDAFANHSLISLRLIVDNPKGASERFFMLSSRPLLLNTHWVIEGGVREPILLVRRTANSYASAADVRSSFDLVRRVVEPIERAITSVLVDMRLAPPRDDPEFERAAADQPKYLSRDFKRSAVLIRTAIGLLHVQRHMQRLGLPMKVFNDEQQAFDYLRGRTDVPSVRSMNIPSRRTL